MGNNVEKVCKLTPMQTGILFQSLKDKDSYIDQFSCRLKGKIEYEKFSEAWDHAVNEYEILRTAFICERVSEPLQVVVKKTNFKVNIADLSELSDEEFAKEAESFRNEDLKKGFTLTEPGLMRVTLLKRNETECEYIWTIHHIIIDGVSVPILMKRVYSIYHSLITGEEIEKNSFLQFSAYVDYIKKQNEAETDKFWIDYLKDVKYPTMIEENRKVDKYENHRSPLIVPDETVKLITKKAKSENISEFHFYNLAYAIMLQRYTNQDSVVYGWLVSGRPMNLAGISKSVGIFINNLPNYVVFDKNATAKEIIQAEVTHQIQENAYEYISPTKIFDLTGFQKGLFDSIFLFENYSMDDVYDSSYTGFSISDEHISESTNFNLNWIIRPVEDRVELNIVYNGLILDDKEVAAMADVYFDILAQIAENTDKKISDICISDKNTGIVDVYGNSVPAWFRGRILDNNNEPTGDVGYRDSSDEIHIEKNFCDNLYLDEKKFDRNELAAALIENGIVNSCAVVPASSDDDKVIICFEGNEDEEESTTARHITKLLSETFDIPKKVIRNGINFVKCSRILQNSDGKVDIKTALYTVENELKKKSINAKVVNFPSTDTEKKIHDIWSEILGRSEIDTKASFFEFNGNSIAIMKIIARIAEILKKNITVSEFSRNATICELAEFVDSKESGAGIDDIKKLTEEEKTEGVEASYSQKRFWFFNQYNKNDIFNCLAESIRLTGNVSVDYLKQALYKLCQSQESLRTVFVMHDGKLYQKIKKEIELPFEIEDIKEGVDQETAVNDFIKASVKNSFSLDNGPLFRFRILRISEVEMVFVFVIHHIISDGWSLQIFFDELMQNYRMIASGENNSTVVPDVQYTEYSEWKKKVYTYKYIQKENEFWKDYLNGMEELTFPNDFNRPAIQSFEGNRIFYNISGDVKKRVDALANNLKVTTFYIYFLAYVALLHRYTQQYDIVVGTPMGARELPGTENTIGCFLNTVVLRSILKKDMTFAEALMAVTNNAKKALENGQYPFDMVVNTVGSKKDMSKNSIFQLMFLFENTDHPQQTLSDIAFERIETYTNASMLDFSLSIQESENAVELQAEYSVALFREETIRRFVSHYENTLKAILDNQEQSIETFDYLTKEEKVLLLEKFNATDTVFDSQLYIHQLFEEQAALNPDREALKFIDESLTYDQLNKRINKLANYLIASGVKKNDIIGVYMERSVEMVVALYGILKAGAAYLPLEPSYPKDRIKYMIENSEVQVVITKSELEERLDDYNGELIVIGGNDATADYSDENPNVKINDDDYAYMIYTSGSTGKPKGVINIHKGIRNRILWIREYFGRVVEARQMQKTPFTFDVSLGELFGSLTNGACLVVAEPGGHRDVDYMIDLIKKEKITHVHFVPSLLRYFVSNSRVEEVASIVKQVCCTGEPLPWDLVQEFKKKLPDTEIYNLYGPTEAAVEVTCWNCREKLDKNIISIGKPMSNTQLYILDPYKQLVPIGVMGELYIAGDNLAVGYYKREQLTSERFISNPYAASERNKLMYRTGDYAVYLPDGNIEFIGRIDNQVKIRGNRVEIGEIETDLFECEGVKECTVIVSKEASPRIIAYVVAEKEYKDNKNELLVNMKNSLKQKLPDYMIPSIFMFIDHFELLPNGKRNMNALPAPELDESKREGFVAAENATQEKILEIWKEVLGLSTISIEDNFFDLGGHSILALEVVSRIKKEFNGSLSVIDFFKYPTIEKFAEMMDSSNGEKQAKSTEDRHEKMKNIRSHGSKMKQLHSKRSK